MDKIDLFIFYYKQINNINNLLLIMSGKENIFSSDESSDEDYDSIKYMDEEDSDFDSTNKSKEEIHKNEPKNIKKEIPLLVGNRILTEYILIDANKYSFKTWKECFPDNNVKLRSLIFNPGWNEFFDQIENKKYFSKLEENLSNFMKKGQNIIPYPELLFNTLNILAPRKIKVIILGQDPYPGECKKGVPNAMGVSFSVPLNCRVPASLDNIYNNMVRFKNLSKKPNHGCLASWIVQGCFLFNSSFTNILFQTNAHQKIWNEFTADLLKYITNKCTNLVFIVWGKFAHILCENIDPNKHHMITSSHPSPMSCDRTFVGTKYGTKEKIVYPSFKTVNHFTLANKYLLSVGKQDILWNLVEID
ncbi:putative uracil-DNA glycosylase [Megavirus courdo7]|uniref:Uracil-DNA glycosylase n=2 Tax=unclassified Megavirus TaxID=3068396 RepID=A0A2K9V7U3_9VIRU|nr:putative uracil-DNA glycosylase [Megavirus courdo7]AUV58287.1 uracil-DNA glycosylase [Bandra megavirus]